MNTNHLIQTILNKQFNEAKTKNASFSLRSFALKAGIGASSMSEILNGKRKVTPKLFKKISTNLNLKKLDHLAVINSFQNELNSDLTSRKKIQLSADQFELISDWYHYAILSLLETKNFKHDISWISQKLQIPKSATREALERLIRLQYISYDGTKFQLRTDYLFAPDNQVNFSNRQAAIQDMELIKKSLNEISIDLRDMASMTIATNLEQLNTVKKMIREFRDKVSITLNQGNTTEVYKLYIHLFPLTNLEQK